MAEDITIPITVKKENLQKILPNFLAYMPLPVDDESNPTMTIKEHIKRHLINYFMLCCVRGRDKRAIESAEPLEKGIIE